MSGDDVVRVETQQEQRTQGGSTDGRGPRPRAVDPAGAGEPGVEVDLTAVLTTEAVDPAWVDAGPFRAHLRHLMAVGPLDEGEVAVLLALPTRAVTHLLRGRAGRVSRRISPHTARRLLLVRPSDVRDLRWTLTPTDSARGALQRLAAEGWSAGEVAGTVGVGLDELEALRTRPRCSRLLSVRLLGLARRLPTTIDDQDLVLLRPAA